MSTPVISFIVLLIIGLLTVLARMHLNKQHKVYKVPESSPTAEEIVEMKKMEDMLDCLVNFGTVKIVTLSYRQAILVTLNFDAVPHRVDGRYWAYKLLKSALKKARTVKRIECTYPNTN